MLLNFKKPQWTSFAEKNKLEASANRLRDALLHTDWDIAMSFMQDPKWCGLELDDTNGQIIFIRVIDANQVDLCAALIDKLINTNLLISYRTLRASVFEMIAKKGWLQPGSQILRKLNYNKFYACRNTIINTADCIRNSIIAAIKSNNTTGYDTLLPYLERILAYNNESHVRSVIEVAIRCGLLNFCEKLIAQVTHVKIFLQDGYAEHCNRYSLLQTAANQNLWPLVIQMLIKLQAGNIPPIRVISNVMTQAIDAGQVEIYTSLTNQISDATVFLRFGRGRNSTNPLLAATNKNLWSLVGIMANKITAQGLKLHQEILYSIRHAAIAAKHMMTRDGFTEIMQFTTNGIICAVGGITKVAYPQKLQTLVQSSPVAVNIISCALSSDTDNTPRLLFPDAYQAEFYSTAAVTVLYDSSKAAIKINPCSLNPVAAHMVAAMVLKHAIRIIDLSGYCLAIREVGDGLVTFIQDIQQSKTIVSLNLSGILFGAFDTAKVEEFFTSIFNLEVLDRLYLDNCRMAPESILALAYNLKNPPLRKLSLANNSLTPQGTQALSASISMTKIQELDLSGCFLTMLTAPASYDVTFADNIYYADYLNLYANSEQDNVDSDLESEPDSVADASLNVIQQFIINIMTNSTVTHLDLSYNNSPGFSKIQMNLNWLLPFIANSGLRALGLSGNRILADDAVNLLAAMHGSNINAIKLNNNYIYLCNLPQIAEKINGTRLRYIDLPLGKINSVASIAGTTLTNWHRQRGDYKLSLNAARENRYNQTALPLATLSNTFAKIVGDNARHIMEYVTSDLMLVNSAMTAYCISRDRKQNGSLVNKKKRYR